MAKAFKKALKRFGYTVATLIILAALVVSAGRLFTPIMNEHLPDFEVWSKEILQVPVKIGHVEISWNIYEPEIFFDHVSILDKNQQAKFEIKEIIVNLNIIRSLASWKPIIETVKLAGVHLSIHHPASKGALLDELKSLIISDNATQSPTNIDEVFKWIFSQPNLILEDVDVDYYLPSGEKKSITLDNLVLKNVASNHWFSGEAILNQEMPVHAEIKLEWSGNIIDFQHATAHLYVYLEGITLSQWFKQYTWNNIQVKQGIGSAKIWMTWKDNQFQQIQSQFQFYDLELASLINKEKRKISRLSGHAGWKRAGDKQIFAGDDILIDLPNQLWPTTSFTVITHPVEDKFDVENIRISYIDLNDAKNFAMWTDLFSPEYKKVAKELDPKGDIRQLKIDFHPVANPPAEAITKKPEDINAKLVSKLQSTSISAQFSTLSFNSWENLPGLVNARGMFIGTETQSNLFFNSPNTTILYDTIFANPLKFNLLLGQVKLQKTNDNAWSLNAKNLQAINSDLRINGDLFIETFPKTAPNIDLSADFTILRAEKFAKYIPVKKMDPELAEWLQQAFLRGKITDGKASIKGQLTEFPFEKDKGNLLITGKVNGIDLQYAPGWPVLKQMNGVLTFSGNSMLLQVDSAQLLKTPLKSIQATIPYIGEKGPQILKVEGNIQTDLAQGLLFIQQSPLQKTLGADLDSLSLIGNMQLQLSMDIPLRHPDNTKLIANGDATKATLSLPSWGIKVTQLNGPFHFTEEKVEAKNLKGLLFNEPINISLNTVNQGKVSYLEAEFNSKLSIANLEKMIKIPLSPYAQGATAFSAKVQLARQSTSASKIILNTDLKGVSLTLPDPYSKTSNQARDLKVEIDLNQNKTILTQIKYDKQLSAALNYKNSAEGLKFVSGELLLGAGDAKIPSQPGLAVTAQFDRLDWKMVQPYFDWIKEQNKSLKTKSKFGFNDSIFRNILIRAKVANLLGQELTNTQINIKKSNTNWLFDIASSQVAGQLKIPTNLSFIDGKFQRFYVKTGKGDDQLRINPKDLPAISLYMNDVRYDDKRVGSLSFDASPSARGLQIKQLRIDAANTILRSSGSWQLINNNYSSRLQGYFSTNGLSQVLNQWGVGTSSLIASKGDAEFDLTWPDAPYTPTVSGLSGDLSFRVAKGRVVNLSESTEAKIGLGRMLSIFSLQTIPRRLSLDFSDLFQNGYSFDSMSGSFKLQNGNANTNNTVFEGPVARIDIAGRIGLKAKDYNLKIGVTTYVTSSILPAAVGAVYPIAGVAAWFISAMVSKASSKNVTYQYQITGPWDNPRWEQIGAAGR